MTRRPDDEGATLVLVLVIVTAVALVMGGLLRLTDTNERTTVALRDQAGTAYAADAAAQVAIKQLQNDTYNNATNGCGSATTEVLSNFYPAAGGAQGASAAVRCTPDPANTTGAGGTNTSPGSALLALGTGAGGEDGIWDGSVDNRTLKVSGGVFSNSTINLGQKSGGTGASGNGKSVIENVATNSYIRALGDCFGPGSISITGSTTKICNYSTNAASATDRRGLDPQLVPGHGTSFDPPAAPTAVRTPPACTGKKVYQLDPGLYRDAPALTALTGSGNSGSCANSVVQFKPGTYYFDFTNTGSHKWTTNSAYVVGGTPTSTLSVSSPPAMTASSPSCVGPGRSGASTTSGVLFVFGGDSRMDYGRSGTVDGRMELCASNATSGPPVALYGLKTAIGSGTFAVAAQSGCITATPYIAGGDATHCAVIQSYQDPTPVFTVRGTVYMPRAPIDVTFNQSSAQYFQWGLVARTIQVSSTGSATALNDNVISVPDDAPPAFPTPSLMYLSVYVCPGAATCDTTGKVRLRAKIQLSASSPTTVTVLSWSVQE